MNETLKLIFNRDISLNKALGLTVHFRPLEIGDLSDPYQIDRWYNGKKKFEIEIAKHLGLEVPNPIPQVTEMPDLGNELEGLEVPCDEVLSACHYRNKWVYPLLLREFEAINGRRLCKKNIAKAMKGKAIAKLAPGFEITEDILKVAAVIRHTLKQELKSGNFELILQRHPTFNASILEIALEYLELEFRTRTINHNSFDPEEGSNEAGNEAPIEIDYFIEYTSPEYSTVREIDKDTPKIRIHTTPLCQHSRKRLGNTDCEDILAIALAMYKEERAWPPKSSIQRSLKEKS